MIIEIFNREKIEMNGQVRGIGDKFVYVWIRY